MTILSEIKGTLQDKLLIFFNEYIIGTRPARKILADLRIMHHTSGKITKKLKALKIVRIDRSIRSAIVHLVALAKTNTRHIYRKQSHHFNKLLSSYIMIMENQIRLQLNLSPL